MKREWRVANSEWMQPFATRYSPFAACAGPAIAGADGRLARRPMLVAMTVEAVVGPAMAPADRRAPERLAVDRADDAAGHCADGSCDHETDAGAGRGADHVGVGARGCRGKGGQNGCCHNKVTHRAAPITRYERASYHAKAFHKVDAR